MSDWKHAAPIPYFAHPAKSFEHDLALGSFSDVTSVNKFGQTSNADTNTATDVWDGANATEDDDLWVAPTVARIHAITSNDGNDTAASGGGTGARTIRIYGLTDWDSRETTEDVSLAGVGAVNTTKSYVIIHRMRVLTCGGAVANIGDIFATAATDGTITAMITATLGQTLMAVYGVPSIQTAHISQYYAAMLKSGGAAALVDLKLLVSVDVKNQVGAFRVAQTAGLLSTGSSHVAHPYRPHNHVPGPTIIKMQALSSVADATINAGFDLILTDN